jgi:hypothetical protein
LGGHYAAQLYEKYRPLGAVVSRGAACPWAWRLALCLAFRVAFGFAGYYGSRFYLNQIQQHARVKKTLSELRTLNTQL